MAKLPFEPHSHAAVAPVQRRTPQVARLRDYQGSRRLSYCRHCGRRRRTAFRRRACWVGLRALWVAAAVSLLPLFILFSPLCIVTLPLWFVFGLAIGPLQELANARLRCAVCRHELHEPTDDRQSAPDKARVDSNEPNQTAAETRVVALNGGWRKRRSR